MNSSILFELKKSIKARNLLKTVVYMKLFDLGYSVYEFALPHVLVELRFYSEGNDTTRVQSIEHIEVIAFLEQCDKINR